MSLVQRIGRQSNSCFIRSTDNSSRHQPRKGFCYIWVLMVRPCWIAAISLRSSGVSLSCSSGAKVRKRADLRSLQIPIFANSSIVATVWCRYQCERSQKKHTSSSSRLQTIDTPRSSLESSLRRWCPSRLYQYWRRHASRHCPESSDETALEKQNETEFEMFVCTRHSQGKCTISWYCFSVTRSFRGETLTGER